jgi:putative ABC transport system permease protein
VPAASEAVAVGDRVDQLDATVLGTYLAQHVQLFHLLLVTLTLVLGLLAVGEILMLSSLERRPHLAMLRALGWAPSTITRFLGVQALGLGMVGGSAAAVLTFTLGLVFGAPVSAQTLGCLVALAVAALAAVLAGIGPMILAYHGTMAAALRGDQTLLG